MKPEEIWAYIDKKGAKATPVRVQALGAGKVQKARVYFLDDVFEGKEVWVPASKLACYWSVLARYEANRASLAALIEQGRPEDHLSAAIDFVEKRFLRHGSYIHTRSAEWGLTTMVRPDLVAGDAHLSVEEVTRDAWWHDSICTVPLATTTQIAAALARANGQEVLQFLEEEEERQSRVRATGHILGKTYISPEVTTTVYEDFTGPYLDILRNWAGEDNSRSRDEVRRWKTQAWTLYALLAETVDELREGGHEDAAWRLHRKLHPQERRKSWTSTRELVRVRDAAREKEHQEAQADIASERYAELGRRTAELEAEIWSETWRPARDR